jgi:hypothetical protein
MLSELKLASAPSFSSSKENNYYDSSSRFQALIEATNLIEEIYSALGIRLLDPDIKEIFIFAQEEEKSPVRLLLQNNKINLC